MPDKDLEVRVYNKKTGKIDKKRTSQLRALNKNSAETEKEYESQSLRFLDRAMATTLMEREPATGRKRKVNSPMTRSTRSGIKAIYTKRGRPKTLMEK
jgi:hypothetical protein